MSSILGVLGIADNERVMVNAIGESVVYDTTMQVLGDHNADLEQAIGVFVERTTADHKTRYKLPGGGYLQEMNEQSRPRAVRTMGHWDVAFPIHDWGREVDVTRVGVAYMSVQDWSLHVEGVMIADRNTMRWRILRRLLKSTTDTFTDPIYGSLTVQPLANGDSVTYPSIVGSASEATEDHYLESGYAAADISDTNNPFITIRDDLEHHFGKVTGGSPLVCFINNAQKAKTEDLTDFDAYPDNYIRPGDQTAVPYNLPTNLPGRVLGRTNGVWVIEWDWIPANYIMALHLDAPKPLMMRVDEAGTGLPTGLSLVYEDEDYPLRSSVWSHRFGIGCGNRLNGVVVELGTGGSYTTPTDYS